MSAGLPSGWKGPRVSGSSSTGDASNSGYQQVRANEEPQGPLFFLSYAHGLPDDQTGSDPDVWIAELYQDLCTHVRELADVPRGTQPGFMDRDLQQGQEWPDQLGNALATCRVFVPLYSKRYFRSEHCGKEWYAFNMRRLNHKAMTGSPVETIIPALWIPLSDGKLPETATSVQYNSPAFNPLYGEHGFYGIMKVRRWRDIYEEVAFLLAKRIVAAAEFSPPVPPTLRPSLIPYDSLPSAFGGNGARLGVGDKRLRITVAAPRGDELPPGRDRGYYGSDFSEWNPYRGGGPYTGGSVRPLAAHAADVARNLSYTPQLGDLFQHDAGLVGREPPSGPEVLLIDPWAVMLPEYRDILQKLDSMDRPWVRVIVVWSQYDDQMRAQSDQLAAALGNALPNKLREGRAASSSAVRGIRSVEEFGRVLPRVLTEAGRAYLRTTSDHLSQGPQIPQGRLIPHDLEQSEGPEGAGE